MQSDALKMHKKSEAIRYGVINPQNYNFNQYSIRGILELSTLYFTTEFDRRTWLLVVPGTSLSTSCKAHKVVDIYT